MNKVFAWLLITLISVNTVFAAESGEVDIGVDWLNKHAPEISAEAASNRQRLSQRIIRSANPPRLNGVGKILLGAKKEDVLAILGAPKYREGGGGDTISITYERARGMLNISFDANGLVSHIIVSSGEVAIPNNLRAGMLLEQFEGVYGGPTLRSTEPISLGKRLVKYPVSHLALVVRSEGNLVETIMVFR